MRRLPSCRALSLALLALSAAAPVPASEPAPAAAVEDLLLLARTDRRAFAEWITAGATSDLERAERVTDWLATHLDWTATDYHQRTVQDILERRGGNCAELARVATALFDELGMKRRSIREINLHVESAERGRTARQKIAELGPRASVFGRRHNDHVWLEIQDRATGEWFPADPSLGVVGEESWVAARLGFGERFSLDPASVDMIAPFAVFAFEGKELAENRTVHYAVEAFDRLYQGSLHGLPAWNEWVDLLDRLDDEALAAFRGEGDLHESEDQIDRLAEIYARLRAQFEAAAAQS